MSKSVKLPRYGDFPQGVRTNLSLTGISTVSGALDRSLAGLTNALIAMDQAGLSKTREFQRIQEIHSDLDLILIGMQPTLLLENLEPV